MEVEEEVEEEEEEEVGKVYRLRSMRILGFREQSSGVVGGDPILPEELQLVSDFCKDVCKNVCVEPFTEGELMEKEPRAAPVFLVGGDVGPTHRRRERERDKEKEEDKEEREP